MEHILKLSEEYRDLNGGDIIQVLNEPPSALEFSRLVHISRPVVIRGLNPTAGYHRWCAISLVGQMIEENKVSVAVTPNGRADALTRGTDGRLYFVEPHVEQMNMADLIAETHDPSTSDIFYLQSQNGNLYSSNSSSTSEFQRLLEDVPQDIPWATEALGHGPEAVNIWCGDGRSVTSIHSDPYENIYTVVTGQKHFFLLPPTDSWCLKERNYPHAQYKRTPSGTLEIVPTPDSTVRWSSITDPDLPNALPKEVVPIRVTLNPGESLYLPIGWWHHIKQTGLTTALNWWYDAEMRGMSWVVLNSLRNFQSIPDGNAVDEEADD